MTQRPSREEEIRLIAYGVWEQEGRPSGKDVEHWHVAEKIWEERQKALSATSSSLHSASASKPASRMRRVNR